jgi:hypothetical protein
MGQRRHSWLAWALFSFVLLSSVGVGLVALAQSGRAAFELLGALWFDVLILPTLAGVGALIVARRPDNRIGLLLLVPALVMSLVALAEPYLYRFTAAPPEPTPLLLALVWFASWSWIWLIFPLLLVVQLFPSGGPLAPRWRLLAYATVGWAALFVSAVTLGRVYTTIEPPYLELPNPFGLLGQQQLELLIGAIWIPGLLLLTGLSTVALSVRFRRAGLAERAQIKWLLYACSVFALVYIGGGVLDLGGGSSVASQIYTLLFGLTVLAIPLAIGIAILRHRLFDIDVVIRRTLLYAALSLALGAVYFLSIVALQALFVRFTGQASTLAVVASTLAIAALFGPLRARVQRFIDRRFFRRKYDAQQVLAQFAARAQREAELDDLSADLLDTVQETLEPERVTLWLLRRNNSSPDRR